MSMRMLLGEQFTTETECFRSAPILKPPKCTTLGDMEKTGAFPKLSRDEVSARCSCGFMSAVGGPKPRSG